MPDRSHLFALKIRLHLQSGQGAAGRMKTKDACIWASFT